MGYGITGWKFGGRQPITQNLNPGQFRGMGKPHFKTSMFVQNNYYGNMGMNMMYDDSCCCNYGCDGGGGSNKFMNWMLGLGMFGQVLGGLFDAFGFGGGSGGSSGSGTADEFGNIKQLYPDGNFAKVGDKYYCRLNGTRYEGSTIDELMSKLPTGTTKTETPAGNEPAKTEFADLQKEFPGAEFIKDGDTYKATLNGKQYEADSLEGLRAQLDADKNAAPAGLNDGGNDDVGGKAGAGKGAGTPAGSRAGTKGKTGTGNLHGWYPIGEDSHTGNDSRLSGCKTAKELAGALIDSKTTGKLNATSAGNKNVITKNQAAIEKALIQANPDKFDSKGNIKAGVDYKSIKIPDIQWISDTFANGTKSSTGNGRTVKRDADGVKQTYSHDGKQLKDSYINAKSYTVTKSGQKYTVKISPDGKEKWYYDSNGKAISERDFKAKTGLSGDDVLKKANTNKAQTKTPDVTAMKIGRNI